MSRIVSLLLAISIFVASCGQPIVEKPRLPSLDESLANLPLDIESTTLDSLALGDPQNYRVYLFDSKGTKRDYYRGLIMLANPSERGELIEMAGMRINLGDGDLEVMIPSDENPAVDSVYRHAGGSTYSKYLVNSHGRTVGLFSVAAGLRVIISIDIDGNEVADYVEIYDGMAQRVTVIVNEVDSALRFYDDFIQGKNALCLMDEVTTSESIGDGGPALGVPDRAKIFGCDDSIESSSESSGGEPNRILGTGNESIVDEFCRQFLESVQPMSFATGGFDRMSLGSETHEDIEKAGATLFMIGLGIVQISYYAGPFAPEAALVGLGFMGRGTMIMVASELEEAVHNDPVVGEESQPYDWYGFCENRANHSGSWSRETLDEMLENQDCPVPNEDDSPADITSSLPGSGSGSSPLGPWVPFTPGGVNDLDCVEPETFALFENVLQEASERARDCNPSSDPGPGEPCDEISPGGSLTPEIGSYSGEYFVGYADLLGLDLIDPGDPAPIDLPGITP